jgi:hypothetical protein
LLGAGLEHETASNEVNAAASESEGMADRMWSTSKWAGARARRATSARANGYGTALHTVIPIPIDDL